MKMQNLKKKGFTLVELVIVIAVVAILAAVLIPTFASLVKRANLSADQQAERQINTLLATEFATDKPETLKEVVDMLDANGYNVDALVPLSKGYKFAWDKENNKIILLADSEVGSYETLDQGLTYINETVSTAKDFKEALIKGQDITLTKNITIDEAITIDEGENVELDLAGFTLTSPQESTGRSVYPINNKGTMIIKNGTIDARGIQNYGVMTLENVTVIAHDSNGGGCVWTYANSQTTIKNVTFKALNGDAKETNGDIEHEPVLISVAKDAKVIIESGTFETNSGAYALLNNGGELIINGGTFTAMRGVVSANSGTTTINGGTFKVTEDYESGWVLYAYNGTINVNGGTFNHVAGRIETVEAEGTGTINK